MRIAIDTETYNHSARQAYKMAAAGQQVQPLVERKNTPDIEQQCKPDRCGKSSFHPAEFQG